MKYNPEVLFNLPEIQISGILLRYHNDIVSVGETGSVLSEKFSDQPLNPISFNRVSRFLGNRDPQPRGALPVLRINQGKVFCVKAFT